MAALIWFGVLAVYIAGLFPAAVKTTRFCVRTTPTRCEQGNSRGYCKSYHRFSCGEVGGREPLPSDLVWGVPMAAAWPLMLLFALILRQAAKPPRIVTDLQRHIADLEAELNIGGQR